MAVAQPFLAAGFLGDSLGAPGEDRVFLVLVPRGEVLTIAHGANEPVDEETEANNPIER